jgi:hypothetical protein
MYCQPQEIISAVNRTGGGAIYRKKFNIRNMREASLHLKISANVIVTIWGSNHPDAVDTADTYWIDLTDLFTGGSSSMTNIEDVCFFSGKIMDNYMLKQVVNNATNEVYAYVAGNV